jgi:hypothetical protein
MLGTTILSALVLLLLGGTLGQDAHAMWLEVHKGIDAHLPVLPTLGMRLFIKRAGEENVLSLNMGALMLMLYTQLSLYVLSLKMFHSKDKALRMLLFFGCSPWVVSFGLLYRVHAMVPLLLVWVTYGFWAVLHSGFKSWSSLWLAISLGLLASSVRLDQVEELSLMVLSLSIAGLLSAKDTKVVAWGGTCCLRAYGFVVVCCTVLMMSSPWLPWLSSNWTIKYPIP